MTGIRKDHLFIPVSALGLLLASFFSHAAGQATDSVDPETSSGRVTRAEVTASEWMVAAANPHASQAGAAMLEAGGNAVDAMVAVQVMLGLVEPQSSGLGGGAFLMYWNKKAQRLEAWDGRETAPINATPRLFQDENGEPLKFWDAVVGGRSVGTPGTLKLLHTAHEKYGKLPWKKVLGPAIRLADKGFEVSPRLASLIEADQEKLSRFPATKAYFFDENGAPLKAGTLLKNPSYAETLRAVSSNLDAFYKGKIADAIVDTVQNAERNPGVLSKTDLANYRVKQREVVCSPYRGTDVCGMGPPTSGGVAVGQILGLLSHYPLAELGPENPESWRLIGDASRLAFADRGRYLADDDFVPVPVEGLLSPEYLAKRAELISGKKALESVSPGEPEWSYANIRQADDESIELPSTSHFAIVDSEGNVVSMTTTIENGFGSRLMTNGFLLNNELTDFSFRTHKDGYPIANRVEPGKRPRSSMSPTIVMKDSVPYMAVGSPGGSRIIGYTAKTIIAHLDWGMDVQSAISLPHLVNRFGTYDVEEGTDAEKLTPALEKMGYKVNSRALTSGLHAIVLDGNTLRGGADPRREGVVIGK
ncbi:gamma-glutamyltransferase [Parasalinivibrio latis]|uniref:gamma-glutamyltransferase n=1 Tax=Parasalinivibrio latis TaxID=2952610 RepID=UPI0030E3A96A